jgi:anthranilate phosphoribosyltransferase
MNIISGKGTEAQQNVVCANAALAIATVENSSKINAFAKAKESLQSGKALEKLQKLQHISQNS